MSSPEHHLGNHAGGIYKCASAPGSRRDPGSVHIYGDKMPRLDSARAYYIIQKKLSE